MSENPADSRPFLDRVRLEEFWHTRATGARRELLIGACLAFAELGYHGASTREIASRARMSPAAVYIYFASKEDLFFAISKDGHQAALDALRNPGDLSADPLERLRLAVSGFAAYHAQMHILVRTVQYELRVLTGGNFDTVASIRRQIDAYLRRLLQDGIDSGQFHIPDLDGTTLLILSFCIDIARWYREDHHRPPAAIGLQYSDLAVKLVTP